MENYGPCMTEGALARSIFPALVDSKADNSLLVYCDALTQFADVVASSSAWPSTTTFVPYASAQSPIRIQVKARELYERGLSQVLPPLMITYSTVPASYSYNIVTNVKSVGDEVQPVIRYFHELDDVRRQLHERRGSNAQEDFMFDIIAPFIERNGGQAIRDIDVTLESMPRSAKFYFPYLLGHIEHEATQQMRLELLYKYRDSHDEDVRDGAIEALGHLSAA